MKLFCVSVSSLNCYRSPEYRQSLVSGRSTDSITSVSDVYHLSYTTDLTFNIPYREKECTGCRGTLPTGRTTSSPVFPEDILPCRSPYSPWIGPSLCPFFSRKVSFVLIHVTGTQLSGTSRKPVDFYEVRSTSSAIWVPVLISIFILYLLIPGTYNTIPQNEIGVHPKTVLSL